MDLPGSTLHGVERRAAGASATWLRRAFLLTLLLWVLAGLVGLLGVRTDVARDSGAGWELSLRHASIARAGLDVPFEVTVRRDGGFDGEVTLALTGRYLDLYETQGFHPEPASTTRGSDLLLLTFTAPPGETLVVAYDAYVQPSSQVGDGGTLSVLDGGRAVASVDFETVLLP